MAGRCPGPCQWRPLARPSKAGTGITNAWIPPCEAKACNSTALRLASSRHPSCARGSAAPDHTNYTSNHPVHRCTINAKTQRRSKMTIAEKNSKQACLIIDALVQIIEWSDGPVTIEQKGCEPEWVIRFRTSEGGSRSLRRLIPTIVAFGAYRATRQGRRIFHIENLESELTTISECRRTGNRVRRGAVGSIARKGGNRNISPRGRNDKEQSAGAERRHVPGTPGARHARPG
jgi:hypothetical protein